VVDGTPIWVDARLASTARIHGDGAALPAPSDSSSGEAPAFVKSEQPFYLGGPVWRIELVSPVWPRTPKSH
jgi:hypothetical protein